MNRQTSPYHLTSKSSTATSEAIRNRRVSGDQSADTRLLDAAQTLVNLQQTSSSSGLGLHQSRRPTSGHQQAALGGRRNESAQLVMSRSGGSRMPPPSAPSSLMGPPPPPTSNVTTRFVVLQSTNATAGGTLHSDNDHGMMQPPSHPPPSRRGRGSKRGMAANTNPMAPPVGPGASGPAGGGSPGTRGRGRGRGRGSKAAAPTPQPPPLSNISNMFDTDEGDDADMTEMPADGLTSQAEEEEKRRRRNGATFNVGHLSIRNDIFDELLNDRKLELLLDPEIQSILERHKATNRSQSGGRSRTLSSSSSGGGSSYPT